MKNRIRQAVGMIAVAAMTFASVSPAAAQDDAPVNDDEHIVISGHGWGHGRGMSQYGSLGYAIDFGWTSDQILDHYYGGTTAGTVPNGLITVRLEAARGVPTVAAVDEGAMVLMSNDGTVTHLGTGGAIRLTTTSEGFVVADAPTCAGPFVDRPDKINAEQVRISTADVPRAAGRIPIGDTSGVTVVAGDWDGDGDDDLGVVDGTTWKLWNTGPTSAGATPDHTLTFGAAGETPLVGDWDGDGVDTPTRYNADGTWTIRNNLDPASSATTSFVWGVQAADIPVVGDWDGDGDDDEGVRRGAQWLLRSRDGTGRITHNFAYGNSAHAPIVGDWNGDGITDIGTINGTTISRQIGLEAAGNALPPAELGPGGSPRIAGDWNDDGVDQLAFVGATTIDLTGPLNQVTPRNSPAQELEHTIQRCESLSTQRYYRGELRAVRNSGDQRTVNALPIESYLRSVVPLEMPASWALLGDGAGAEAVQTQAVSARSYALAENRASYAKTCDTISCQVYAGRAARINGSLSINENVHSDQAIMDTAGEVRMRDGEVARTEFSSSTGGWSAGGVFPAVEDLGDAVARNPNHDWTVVLDVSTVEARYSGRTLTKASVTERNGLGQDGGRVFEVTLVFGEESFTMTGNEFRRAFGLKSDWFTIDWEPHLQPTDCICPEDWPAHGLDEHFISG